MKKWLMAALIAAVSATPALAEECGGENLSHALIDCRARVRGLSQENADLKQTLQASRDVFADPVALFSVVTVTDVLREYSSDFGKIGRALFWKLHVLFEVGPREMRRPEPFAALRARYSTEAAIRSFFGSATPTILKLADSAGVRGHFAQKGKAIEPLLKKEVDPLLAQVGMQWLFEFHCHHEEESEQRNAAKCSASTFPMDFEKYYGLKSTFEHVSIVGFLNRRMMQNRALGKVYQEAALALIAEFEK